MQPLTLYEIQSIYNIVREASEEVGAKFALSGGASLFWLGVERPTYDLDFVADKHIPLQAAETYPNRNRYRIAGRIVDWVVQTDSRASLFAESIEEPILCRGLKIVPIEYLIAFKSSSDRSKDFQDIEFIKSAYPVDLEKVARILRLQANATKNAK